MKNVVVKVDRSRIDRKVLFSFLVFAIAIVSLTSFAISALSTNTIDNGLVAYWRFDEGGGPIANDTIDGNDGTIYGARWVDGKYGEALRFDGSNDYVRANIALSSQQVTACGWFKQIGSWSEKKGFVQGNGYNLHLWATQTGTFSYGAWTTNTNEEFTSTTVYDFSKWTFACVVNKGADYTKLYVNGKFDEQSSIVGNLRDITFFEFGRHPNYAGNYMDGIIDEVRVYNRTLSAAEIRALYNKGAAKFATELRNVSGKVLDITFDNKNSTHVYDTSGNNNHGVIEGTATQKTANYCKVGRCFEFDDSNDKLDDVGLDLGNEWTIMTWFLSPLEESSHWRTLTRGNAGDHQIIIESGSYDLGTYDNTGGTGFHDCGYDINSVSDGWHHLAAVQEWSTNSIKFYIDGIQVCTVSNYNSTTDIRAIGNYQGEGQEWGTIDQFKVFNRVLTQKEIIEEAGLERKGAVLDLRFDEGGGDVVWDISVHNNTGRLKPGEGNMSEWADGVSGSALRFDGVDDYVEMGANNPSLTQIGGDEVTVEAWVKPDLLSGSQYIVQKNGPVFLFLAGNNLKGGVYTGTWTYVTGNIVLSQNRWHHLVVVYDGSNIKLYVNGQADASTPKTGDLQGNGCVQIGQYTGGACGAGSSSFTGTIDEVKIYPYDITAAEVKQHYTEGVGRVKEVAEPQDPGRDGLVLDIDFDYKNSTHVIDKSGVGNHGKITGPVQNTSGVCKVGRCMQFDVSGDYIELGDDDSLDLADEDHTLCAWFKTTGSEEDIISSGTGAGNYLLMAYQSTGKLRGHVWTDSSSNTIDSVTTVNDGAWHHGCQAVDSTKIYVYVDGLLDNSQDLVGTKTGTAGAVYIGCRDPGSTSAHFGGMIDEAKIYNRSLSKEEIWYLYNSGEPAGEWRFDNNTGSTAYDTSVNSNDGTLGNGTAGTEPSWTTGKYGNALSFDGSGSSTLYEDVVVVSDSDSIDVDVSTGFTLSVWINPTSYVCTAILRKNGQFELFRCSGGNHPATIRIWKSGTTDHTGAIAIPDGQWTHLVATNDKSTTKLYVNGVLDGSWSDSGTPSSTTNDLGIGAYPSGQYSFNGAIDQVKIFPYALTADQIKEEYNKGALSVGI